MNGGMAPLGEDLCRMARASNGFVIELGLFSGSGSTVAFQDGLALHPDRLLVSVEWDMANLDPAYRPTVPWWHLVEGDSTKLDTLEAVRTIAGDRKPSLLFIDTHHVYGTLMAELKVWSQIATDETIWIGHDSWMMGEYNTDMMRALEEWAPSNGWRWDDYRQDSHGLWRMTR
jgi:cephalosporin hydroxylase